MAGASEGLPGVSEGLPGASEGLPGVSEGLPGVSEGLPGVSEANVCERTTPAGAKQNNTVNNIDNDKARMLRVGILQ